MSFPPLKTSAFAALLALAGLTACTAPRPLPAEATALGGATDAQGCLPAAGQSWSALRGACIQPFDVADLKLDDPAHDGLAVYVIFSADRSRAEVFAADAPAGSVVLQAVKGGYASEDARDGARMRLLRDESHPRGWRVRLAR